jgi:hypothetical protein
MSSSGSSVHPAIRSVAALLLTGGIVLGCEPPGEISGPASETFEGYTLLSEFSIEKGSDADSSYIALRGVRKEGGTLELQATSWGIRETGLFLMRSDAPRTAIFAFMGYCGTVSSRTWEKTMITCELTPADQDTVERILFTSHGDTVETVRIRAFHDAPLAGMGHHPANDQ